MEKKLITISEIIKISWEIYTNNLAKFIVPILISLLLPIITGILSMLLIFNFWLLIFILALSLFISLWVSIYYIITIDKIYNQQKIDIHLIYNQAFAKVPAYLWVNFITGITIILGLIIFIIPGLIFIIWLGFCPYINVLESTQNRGFQALQTSKDLVNKRFWPTAWRLIIPPLSLYLILAIFVVALTYVISGGHIDLMNPNSQSNLILNLSSSILLNLLAPLFFAFTIVLYNNLKQTKITP
jgi:hypothetical protein